MTLGGCVDAVLVGKGVDDIEVFEDSAETLLESPSALSRQQSAEFSDTKSEESFLWLCLACEKLRSERVSSFLSHTMQEPEICLLVGQAAGFPAVCNYGAIARGPGLAMREAVNRLYAGATPNVYICGGASMYHGVLDRVSRFSLRDGTWEMMPSMPTARRLCAAAAVAGLLYVFGGETEQVPLWYTDTSWRQYRQLKTVECFNPFTGVWKPLQDMPTAKAGCSAVGVHGMPYVVGGRVDEDVRACVERFDTAVGGWERLPEMPTARSGCSALELSGLLYVVGGKGNGEIFATVERFDPGVGWWQILPPMPTPRSASASGTISGKIYVAGGFDGVKGCASVDCFDPAIGHWESKEPMQTWRIGAATAVAGGKLYILGGKTGGEHALMCEHYDPSTGVWGWLPPMPQRHVYCAGAAVVGCL